MVVNVSESILHQLNDSVLPMLLLLHVIDVCPFILLYHFVIYKVIIK